MSETNSEANGHEEGDRPAPAGPEVDPSASRAGRYLQILNQQGELICCFSPHLAITFANQAFADLVDQPAADLISRSLDSFVRPEDFARLSRTLESPDSGREPLQFDLEVESRSKGAYWLGWMIYPNLNPDGCLVEWIAIGRDITGDRRKTATIFHQSNMLAAVMDAVILTDLSFNIVDWNGYAETLYGWKKEEVIGQNVSTITKTQFPLQNGWEAQEALFAQKHWRGEVIQSHRDGHQIDILSTVSIFYDEDGVEAGVIAVNRDITERKRSEEMLRRSQKLESLGLMAGGIAHDFNNLLTALVAQITLAKMKSLDHPGTVKHLERAEAAAQRAADLTGQLLTYSGRRPAEVRRIDINRLIEDQLQIFRLTIPQNVYLTTTLTPEITPIEGDATQIQQILMNLILNGAEAIEDTVGTVFLETRVVHLDAPNHEAIQPLGAGDYVNISVSDTGSGMDAATIARIFDPFFTTKPSGRGLGLSSVLGIVKSHNGGLAVASNPGKGTRFDIYFPALPGPLPAASSPEETGLWPAAKEPQRQILIVDDDAGVRTALVDIVEALGHRAQPVPNGWQAVAAIGEKPEAVSLILLDLTMPGLNGVETHRRIREINPDVPIILTTAYPENKVDEWIRQDRRTSFLSKPYSVEAITTAIEKIFAETGNDNGA